MKKKLVRDFLILLGLFVAAWVFFAYYPVFDSEEVKTSYIEKEELVKQKLVDFMDFKKSGSDKTLVLQSLEEIRKKVQDPDVSYDLYYSNSDEINAFALPGNIIVINKGLILNTNSHDELIGVLAHEVGHLKMKHHTDKILTSLGVMLLFSGSNTTTGEIAEILTNNAFSRSMEEEADDYAIKKMQEIGVSPYKLAIFFKTLYQETKFIPDFMNTHPGIDKRIKKFSKFEDKESNLHFTVSWSDLKNSL